jgi:predicted RNA-binding Zn ribbon-like protein
VNWQTFIPRNGNSASAPAGYASISSPASATALTWLSTDGATPRILAAGARRLRETLYRVVTAASAGARPNPIDLHLLNAAARTAALVPQLAAIGEPPEWTSDQPYEAVLATIARDAIDLLSSASLKRVRKCAGGHCSILFLDTSRPGKRRWCSMNGCGNKVKKAAYRQRQKS